MKHKPFKEVYNRKVWSNCGPFAKLDIVKKLIFLCSFAKCGPHERNKHYNNMVLIGISACVFDRMRYSACTCNNS